MQLNRKWLCGSWLEDEESVFCMFLCTLCTRRLLVTFIGFLFTDHLARKKNHYRLVSFCADHSDNKAQQGFFSPPKSLPIGFLSQGGLIKQREGGREGVSALLKLDKDLHFASFVVCF